MATIAAPPKTRPTPRLPRLRWRWLGAIGLAFSLFALGVYFSWPRPPIPARVVNDTVRLPLSPPSDSVWTTEDVFPQLRFFEPTCAVCTHDADHVFVLERRGTLQIVDRTSAPAKKHAALDISERVIRTPYDDDGALGVALHPEFDQPKSPNRDYLYMFYTARVDDDCYDRLSRFTVAKDRRSIDARSELVLIDQLDENLWHNGGGLAFGPDGFLYVGVGDEGQDADGLRNGQRIDKDLFSGILRIDVDRRGGEVSHPPRRSPETGKTAHYYIPNDNPFVGVASALEEFWSIGLRNPHRIDFDRETGKLWVGDVGHLRRERIYIASAGSNHGWSYLEGTVPFTESYLQGQRPELFHGVETPPVFEYPHLSGNNCVIGGFVYRGSEHPALQGKYIYADNGSGRIFALEHDGDGAISNVELTALPVTSKTGISSIAEGPGGEPWVIVLGEADETAGTIHRLVPAPSGAASNLPRYLSETGVFADLETLTPSPGVYPYSVNSPLWSDGARKRRWILLPGDGGDPDPTTDRITFSAKGDWEFPDGTVFIKHFELPIDETDPSAIKRLETRLLVCTADGGVYGVTYKWNEAQTDAELVQEDLLEPVAVETADGGSRTQTWQYPGRQTCLVCHTENAGYVLGVNTRQLNGLCEYPRSGVRAHQLQAWSDAGFFTRRLDDAEIASADRLVELDDKLASLEHRVRSYLDSNCGACHRPGGVRANFDARFDTPLDAAHIIDGKLNSHKGMTDVRVVRPGDPARSMLVHRMLQHEKPMPPVGVMRRDIDAIGLLTRWIDSLPAPPVEVVQADEAEPHASPAGG